MSVKLDGQPKFIAFDKGSHTLHASAGIVADAFKVNVGMKQGCVLASTLFNIHFAAVTLLGRQILQLGDGLCLRYRLDCRVSVFNLFTHTNTKTTKFSDLQYVEDAACPSLHYDALQHNIDVCVENL